jgi:hypothetical protein
MCGETKSENLQQQHFVSFGLPRNISREYKFPRIDRNVESNVSSTLSRDCFYGAQGRFKVNSLKEYQLHPVSGRFDIIIILQYRRLIEVHLSI